MVRQLQNLAREIERWQKMTIVRMCHIRQANLCAAGTRSWFVNHGFDWTSFLVDGIAAEKLAATGDALALRVVEIAKKDNAHW